MLLVVVVVEGVAVVVARVEREGIFHTALELNNLMSTRSKVLVIFHCTYIVRNQGAILGVIVKHRQVCRSRSAGAGE